MTSTLGHALLGLLAREPATGYDLSRSLRRPVGWFWSAGHSQVYPELARLEGDGLVRHTVVAGAGPRDTKRYRLTPAGRKALRGWLLATTPDVDDREVLLRAYLLFVLTPAEAAGVVRMLRAHHERLLATYDALDLAAPDAWGAALTEHETWQWGRTFERERIAWCDRLLARVERAVPPR